MKKLVLAVAIATLAGCVPGPVTSRNGGGGSGYVPPGYSTTTTVTVAGVAAPRPGEVIAIDPNGHAEFVGTTATVPKPQPAPAGTPATEAGNVAPPL